MGLAPGNSDRRAVSRGWPRWPGWLRSWPLFSLEPPLRGFVIGVIGAGLAAAVTATALTTWHARDALSYAVLLGLGVLSVEASRRLGEAAGVSRDAHGLWELPIAIVLPPAYALFAPAVVLALTQWRVRRTLAHRRVFSAAALGVSGAAASVLFHTVWGGTAPLPGGRPGLLGWGLLVAACGLLRWAASSALVLTAVRLEEPSARPFDLLGGWPSLGNDAVELGAGVLATFCAASNPLLLLFAVPCGVLLQRSARHTQRQHASRADRQTGLLAPAAWRREAGVRVALAAQAGLPQAVAIVHVDRYPDIEARHGPRVVGRVLREVADALVGGTGGQDLNGRFGRAEFIILLERSRASEALCIAELLRARISEITLPAMRRAGLATAPGQVTVSIGVAALGGPGSDLLSLLAAADAALHRARSTGCNSVRLAGLPHPAA
jgi:diguanylate cyclase (GGDEF)-like protein